MKQKQPVKIVIFGYFGYGSLGDEAILSGMINSLHEEVGSCTITVLSQYPDIIKQLHNVDSASIVPMGIRSLLAWIFSGRFIATMGSFLRADLFIFGGGGFLSDELRWQNVFESLVNCAPALVLGVPMITYSLGAGPIAKPLSKFIVKLFFSYFRFITVRDIVSKQCLADTGLKKEITLTADPALCIVSEQGAQLKDISSNPIAAVTKRNRIGLAPAAMYFSDKTWPDKKSNYELLLDNFARIGDFASDKLNADIYLFQVSPNVDTDFCALIQKKMKSRSYLMYSGYTHLELAGAFEQMDMMIGSRFHSIVLSTAVGTPFVALIYHHKTNCFLEQIKQLHRSVPLFFDMDVLSKLIVDTWNNRVAMKSELSAISKELKKSSKIPAQMASRLIL